MSKVQGLILFLVFSLLKDINVYSAKSNIFLLCFVCLFSTNGCNLVVSIISTTTISSRSHQCHCFVIITTKQSCTYCINVIYPCHTSTSPRTVRVHCHDTTFCRRTKLYTFTTRRDNTCSIFV